MKAISCVSPTNGEKTTKLFDIQREIPTVSHRDVLVKIAAVSVNPIDTKVRKNEFPAGANGILGWDAVGEVVGLGEGVEHFSLGDKVWYAGDLTRDGSNAQYQVVDERIISLAPSSLTDAEAAALPLTALTAWEMLFERFGLTQESSGNLLIIGGAGGVGSIAIQLLKARTNMQVIATASREETKTWVKDLGADYVIDHRQDFLQQLLSQGIDSVDYVFSTNATDSYTAQIAQIMTPQGKLGLIDDPQTFDIMPLKLKSISTHWELMFTRSMFKTADLEQQGEILKQLAELIDSGKVTTTTDHSFGVINAQNLTAAHQLIESGTARGKVVLSGFEE